jgi:hypothetical protein
MQLNGSWTTWWFLYLWISVNLIGTVIEWSGSHPSHVDHFHGIIVIPVKAFHELPLQGLPEIALTEIPLTEIAHAGIAHTTLAGAAWKQRRAAVVRENKTFRLPESARAVIRARQVGHSLSSVTPAAIPFTVTNCAFLLYWKRNSLAPPARAGV